MAMSLPPGTQKLWDGTKNLGGAGIDAVSATAKKLFGGGKDAGGFAASQVGKAAVAGGKVADGTVGIVGSIVNRLGNGVRRFPVASAVLGIGAAGLAVKHHYENKQAAAMDAAAFAQPSYMNSVNAEEAAMMQARMRDGGGQPGNFAAAEAEKRAAAATSPVAK